VNRADIFSRSIAFWGEEQQDFLAKKSIFIGGVGAVGCVVAEILLRAGIGRLYLADRGYTDPPDLNRQALYTVNDIGKAKVFTAAERLQAMTGQTEVIPLEVNIGKDDISGTLSGCEGAADCLDNFPSRFALEESLTGDMFLVSGAILRDYGQVTTIVPGRTVSLRELYGSVKHTPKTVPVIAPIVFCLGSLVAQEILMNIRGEPRLLNTILAVGMSGFLFDRIPLTPLGKP